MALNSIVEYAVALFQGVVVEVRPAPLIEPPPRLVQTELEISDGGDRR